MMGEGESATPAQAAELEQPVGILEGLRGDIEANLGVSGNGDGLLTLIVRVLTNPQVRACLLVRLTAAAPGSTRWVWRNLLITLHSIDVQPGAVLAPGLELRHPFGIVIGAASRIGSNVMLAHHVTVNAETDAGERRREPTVIEDHVWIYPNSTITAGVRIGAGAVIGSNAFVTRDVDPGGVVHAHSKH